MENNMSDMLKNLSNMLNNKDSESKEIPDDFKNILNNFMKNSNKDSTNSAPNNSSTDDTSESSEPGIDINTILKMQKIMQGMNSQKNNSRATLLRSLKPYLKPSRQEKVEQYIQLFNMEKVIEMLNNNGGEKK